MHPDLLLPVPFAGAGATCTASECTNPDSCTADEEAVCIPGEGACPEQGEPEPEPELQITTVQPTWTPGPQSQVAGSSLTYLIVVAGSVLLLLGAACAVWRCKARRRGEDEAKTTAQSFAKASAVPLAMRPNATPKRQVGARAGQPLLPLTMGDVVKVQRRPRPVSPPASTRTAATVVRATTTMKRHIQPGTHAVLASRPASPRGTTPPRLPQSQLSRTPPRSPQSQLSPTPPRLRPRPVSPPLFTRAVSSTQTAQAAANAFRTRSASGTAGRLPPRHARQPRTVSMSL